MKKGEELLCMNDWDVNGKLVNQSLYGRDENVPHRTFELIFKPCTPEVMTSEQTDADYETKCLVKNATIEGYERKLQEAKAYLGMVELIFVYNTENLDLMHFGSDSILRDATVMNYQWSTGHPTFL